MKITIVIPTYNEIENLPLLAESLFALPIQDLNMLVVDDNSPDGTGKLAEDLNQKYPNHVHVLHRSGKLGLGSAYIHGFSKALKEEAEIIGQMDADFSHPIERIPALIEALKTHDFALGSRYVHGGSLDERWPFWRKGLSSFGNFYARSILGLSIRDVTGGYRFWRASTLGAMPLNRVRSNGYVFQVEMAYIATRLDFSCAELPIHFADRRLGTSKMNLRIQIEAAIRVWQLPGMYRDIRKIPMKSSDQGSILS